MLNFFGSNWHLWIATLLSPFNHHGRLKKDTGKQCSVFDLLSSLGVEDTLSSIKHEQWTPYFPPDQLAGDRTSSQLQPVSIRSSINTGRPPQPAREVLGDGFLHGSGLPGPQSVVLQHTPAL